MNFNVNGKKTIPLLKKDILKAVSFKFELEFRANYVDI